MEFFIKHILLLHLLVVLSFNCLEIVRDFRGDRLSCPSIIDCTYFGSKQLDNTTCSCNGGTFIQTKDGIKCFKSEATTEECKFSFSEYDDEILTISVEKKSAGQFFKDIISKHMQCEKLELETTQYMNHNLQWTSILTKDFSLSKSVLSKFYLKWTNEFKVNKTMYSGQLLKFVLNCKSTDQETVKSCIYGKIIGSRDWYSENAVNKCNMAYPLPPYKKKNKETTKEINKVDMMLVGAIIATILLLVLFVTMVIFCIRRRRINNKYPNDNDGIRLPAISNQQPASDYVEPNTLFTGNEAGEELPNNNVAEFQNKAYLTQLRMQPLNKQNSDENYDVPFENELLQHNSLIPKSIKQKRTAPAKSIVSQTTDNVYEPICNDYEDPDYINPEAKTSYSNLEGINWDPQTYQTLDPSPSTVPAHTYHALNPSPSTEPVYMVTPDAYVDMSGEEAPIYEIA